MSTLLIPDLSEWQGDVNWTALVGAGYPAAIIRAYNGTRVDHDFVLNREHAHAAGVRALGLYAYLDAGRNTRDQAAEFVHTVGVLRAGEWPIVDCETGSGAAARVKEWAGDVARMLGHQAWLYSGDYFYRSQHLDASGVPGSRTWLAAWGPHEPREQHALWQYTDHRTLPGVKGAVDCSEYHGTIEQLLAAIRFQPARPTPGPTTHPSHPYPAGIHPGGTTPSARPLQQALKRTHWMDASVVESDHYGPVTQHAVAGFNRKHHLNDTGKSYDPAIGPRGWALLMTLAYGAA